MQVGGNFWQNFARVAKKIWIVTAPASLHYKMLLPLLEMRHTDMTVNTERKKKEKQKKKKRHKDDKTKKVKTQKREKAKRQIEQPLCNKMLLPLL